MVVTVNHTVSHGLRLSPFILPFAIMVVPNTLFRPGGYMHFTYITLRPPSIASVWPRNKLRKEITEVGAHNSFYRLRSKMHTKQVLQIIVSTICRSKVIKST